MDSTTTQTASAGLRERKKLATKQALALAAMKLAVQRGLENVRVEDIAAAANVSRRTFTNYFASKEEAIASLSAGRFARAAQALRDRPASEPMADSLAEVPLTTAIAERTGADPRGDLHPRVLAAAVMAAVRTATAQWGISDGSLPDLIRQAVRQVAEHSAADATPALAPGPDDSQPESNQPDSNQPR